MLENRNYRAAIEKLEASKRILFRDTQSVSFKISEQKKFAFNLRK
jgi:hypothetical protein